MCCPIDGTQQPSLELRDWRFPNQDLPDARIPLPRRLHGLSRLGAAEAVCGCCSCTDAVRGGINIPFHVVLSAGAEEGERRLKSRGMPRSHGEP